MKISIHVRKKNERKGRNKQNTTQHNLLKKSHPGTYLSTKNQNNEPTDPLVNPRRLASRLWSSSGVCHDTPTRGLHMILAKVSRCDQYII